MEQSVSATLPGRRPNADAQRRVWVYGHPGDPFYRLFALKCSAPLLFLGHLTFQTSRHDALLYSDFFQRDVWTQVIPGSSSNTGTPAASLCGTRTFTAAFRSLPTANRPQPHPLDLLFREPRSGTRAHGRHQAVGVGHGDVRPAVPFWHWARGAFLGGAVWVLSAFNIRWLLCRTRMLR